MTAARTYQLLLDVDRPLQLIIGALGRFDLPAGRYIYTGSAKRNFEARVARHASWADNPSRPRHWHIDYLLAAPGVTVAEVRRYAEDECAVQQRSPGATLIPGFGASDCRAGCGSHLKYLGK
jgi:Uri superfamily endonuclease